MVSQYGLLKYGLQCCTFTSNPVTFGVFRTCFAGVQISITLWNWSSLSSLFCMIFGQYFWMYSKMSVTHSYTYNFSSFPTLSGRFTDQDSQSIRLLFNCVRLNECKWIWIVEVCRPGLLTVEISTDCEIPVHFINKENQNLCLVLASLWKGWEVYSDSIYNSRKKCSTQYKSTYYNQIN